MSSARGNAINDRNDQLAQIGRHFARYLSDHTGIDVPEPDSVNAGNLDETLAKLDAALAQMGDFASVYGLEPAPDYEQLVLPASVLAGEYLRVAAGAVWIEPEVDADRTVHILTPNGVGTDLTNAVRINVMNGEPNLRSIVDRLLKSPDEVDEE